MATALHVCPPWKMPCSVHCRVLSVEVMCHMGMLVWISDGKFGLVRFSGFFPEPQTELWLRFRYFPEPRTLVTVQVFP